MVTDLVLALVLSRHDHRSCTARMRSEKDENEHSFSIDLFGPAGLDCKPGSRKKNA